MLILAVIIGVGGCGATRHDPVEPTGNSSSDQPELAERFLGALTSCEARARCCPDLEETNDVCEAGMRPLREMLQRAISGSQLMASGAARFDSAAIAALEEDVAACRPLLQGDAFLNSVITGTVPEGGRCGDGNAIDAAACQDGLECLFRGSEVVCSAPPEGDVISRPPPTVESTYCRPFLGGGEAAEPEETERAHEYVVVIEHPDGRRLNFTTATPDMESLFEETTTLGHLVVQLNMYQPEMGFNGHNQYNGDGELTSATADFVGVESGESGHWVVYINDARHEWQEARDQSVQPGDRIILRYE